MKKYPSQRHVIFVLTRKIFPKDYSNRAQNLNGQIFLTDSILDIFVLEIWDHSIGWVGKRTHQNSPIVTNFHQISPIWTNLDQIWKHHLDFPYYNIVYIWQVKITHTEMNTFVNKDFSLSKTSMLNVLITINIPNCN